MGLFDSLATPVEEIHVGFGLPNGEFEVRVSEINLVEKKDGKGSSVVIKYTVEPGHALAGKTHDQWLTVPDPAIHGAEKAMTFATFLKQGLMNIGVPEGAIAVFDPENPDHTDQVIGNTGVLKLKPQKSNPQYQNVNFYLDEDQKSEQSGVSDVQVPSNTPTPAASEELDLSNFGI